MNVTVLGIGLMGLPMGKRLREAGFAVTAWNRTQEKALRLASHGARVAHTAAQAVRDADVVITMLDNGDVVESVLFGQGVAQVLKPGTLVIDMSSIRPAQARQHARRLAEHHVAHLDAPVSGGTVGAEAGTLAIMAGGRADTLARLEPVMRAYAARVTHMGEVGAGQVTKLCNQTIVATTLAAISEAVALAQANGIDAAKFTEALAGGWADSTLLQIFVPRMTGSNTPIIGALRIMQKDVDNVAACAGATATPMPVLSATQQSYRLAASQGWGDADLSEIVRVAWPRRGQAEQG